MFCVIGWLDVSVECCVFCSSVLSVRKRTFAKLAGEFFSHRTHRFNRTFPPTFRTHRRPPAYRIHRGLSTKISCNVLWYRLTWCLCEPLCVLFFCVLLWEIESTLWMRLGLWDLLVSFFSHRTHRFNRTHLRTISIPQTASGIQISQNVTAKEGCWLMGGGCWWLALVGVGWWLLGVDN